MRALKTFLYFLFHTRLLYSALFCFKHLPFKQAIRVPIIFYPHSQMKIKGHIQIISEQIKTGMISVGFENGNFCHYDSKTILFNEGLIQFRGINIKIMSGTNLHVTQSGTLDIGEEVVISPLVRIYCCKQITLERGTRIAHECQLFDSGFHYIENTASGEIAPIVRPIHIEEWCWIGNRTTINKGVRLPKFTIVASGSLLNKDYTTIIQPESIIGGSPARLIKKHCRRVWNPDREKKFYKMIDQISE